MLSVGRPTTFLFATDLMTQSSDFEALLSAPSVFASPSPHQKTVFESSGVCFQCHENVSGVVHLHAL